ncbi:DNA replication protein dnaC [Slackia heliotrinireducens]|uniref:DNA replication protein n=1 Tax=Slackia heliotrinireducens (strain ATCC 29202 / DSM 20476 / NCTC 11029 / RHS 1) TaxID=471855 RepID=C7N298_SLAHD|nr:IS21-like element helper ATPase IstB [Slackia heliotrinireducens]ACV21404.1 DNA replication protein [Slackia heliotrinireducens DSM 20476]VEG98840.1 DNA replication protein dnaC [Slackia heliotrinireducens]
MISRCERDAIGDAIRADARKLCISNDTVGWFLESATPRQLDAVAGMLAHEIAVRGRNRKARLLRKAAFPAVKSVADFDFADVRMPDGHTVEDMLSLDWVEKAQDYVFHGQTGRGKTHLAVALGMRCVERGLTVRYLPCAQLVLQLQRARDSGGLDTMYSDLAKADLLILDEFGYIPLDSDGARLLFQVISSSYESRSLILTTNIEFSKWGTVLADEKLAAAAVDRIVHHGRLVEFGGKSRRVEESLMLGNVKEG